MGEKELFFRLAFESKNEMNRALSFSKLRQ